MVQIKVSFFAGQHINLSLFMLMSLPKNTIGFYSVSLKNIFINTFVQEFRSEDTQDLYLEEREVQLKSAEEEKRKVQMTVPGIINPHDIPEDMQD